MDSLPRDSQLCIIKKLDIDTRINLGIFCKLKIPESIKEKISRVCEIPKLVQKNSGEDMFYQKILGLRQVIGYAPGMYILRYYHSKNYVYNHNKDRVYHEVILIKDDSKLDMFALLDGDWKKVY